jgi:hypothetical protein
MATKWPSGSQGINAFHSVVTKNAAQKRIDEIDRQLNPPA